MKKILAVVMVLSMIMAPFMTISVGAAEGLSPSKTEGYTDCYSIKSKADFDLVASYVAEDTTGANKYVLDADIDLGNLTNYYLEVFCGYLYGNGHSITVNITGNANYVALIKAAKVPTQPTAKTTIGVIDGVTLKGSINSSAARTAGFVASGQKNARFVVQNCVNEATISSSGIYTAGFVANGAEGGLAVEKCINKGNISSTGDYVAGIIGSPGKYVMTTDCQNYGTISGPNSVGGIVAYSSFQYTTQVANSVNYGKITGSTKVGGIIGDGRGVSVLYCQNYGEVTGTSKVGGIAGYTTTSTRLSECINFGKAINTTDNKYYPIHGDTINQIEGTPVRASLDSVNNYYLKFDNMATQVGASEYSTADAVITAVTTNATTSTGTNDCTFVASRNDVNIPYILRSDVELQTVKITFELGNGSVVDFNSAGNAVYNYLCEFKIDAPDGQVADKVYANGIEIADTIGNYVSFYPTAATTITATYKTQDFLDVSKDGYYLINSKEDFLRINEKPDGNYKLMTNINLGSTIEASYIPTFSGELNGNNKSVTININTEETTGEIGLIGRVIEGANIHDLTIKGSVTALYKAGNVAALAGMYAPDAAVNTSIAITNVTNEADVKALSSVAGVIGSQGGGWNWEHLTLTNVVNKGDITAVEDGSSDGGRMAAGIIFTAHKNTKLYNCVNYGTITAEDFSAGGIYNNGGYGSNAQTKIYGCMNFGKIDGKSQVGGIGVIVYGHDIQDCVNAGEIVITAPVLAGGIVGYCDDNGSNSQIVDCINVGKFTYSGSDPVNPIGGQGITQDGSRIVKISGNFYLDNNALYSDATNSTKFSTLDVALTALNTDTANGYTYVAAPVDVEFPYPVISGVTLATKNVTFDVTGDGSVDIGTNNVDIGTNNVAKVIYGTSVPFKVTPADGNYIKTVVLNNKPIAGYVTNATLTTPSVKDDITYFITFAEGAAPAANTVTTALSNPGVVTENEVEVLYVFARLAAGYGNEYGMLITTDENATMEVGIKGVQNAVATEAPNVLGNFGIRFVGGTEGDEASLPAGTYYVRPYAKYNGEYKYGEPKTFVVE